ncbi:Autophagy-related protein 3 [Acorus calamus]|uniref:Autophagy-related protein 3 n=1 Tax=Acorus calamus TaxID=4465 RepID=A0AAV9DL87_ACOCL|nr:Autophagy-related protein 3 [Acorus calamus]
MPLQLERVLEDVSQDHTHQTVMIEDHPHLQGEHASIHPCKHARVMNKIIYVILSSGAEPEVNGSIGSSSRKGEVSFLVEAPTAAQEDSRGRKWGVCRGRLVGSSRLVRGGY